MADNLASDTTAICEEILRTEKQYNLDHDILRSEIVIIDRLLGRRIELIAAYAELHDRLGARPHALKVFIGVLLSTAAIWSPEKIVKSRDRRQRLEAVNALVAEKASELATLLREREALHNDCGFAGNTHYHVCRVIEDAARENHLFRSWVRDDLRALRGRFDLKYWPRIHHFMDTLALDAEHAELEATDPITAAATTGPRASRADFFKALFAAIEENSTATHGFIPAGLKLSDGTLASLANCVLDLGPDDLLDSAYVKRLRQRERNSAQMRNADVAPLQ